MRDESKASDVIAPGDFAAFRILFLISIHQQSEFVNQIINGSCMGPKNRTEHSSQQFYFEVFLFTCFFAAISNNSAPACVSRDYIGCGYGN